MRGVGSALKGEGEEVKRNAINAAISSLSMIPFADVAKVFKLRTLARAGGTQAKVAKKGMEALRTAKNLAGTGKIAKGTARKQQIAMKAAGLGVRGGKAGAKGYDDEEGPVVDVPATVEPQQRRGIENKADKDYWEEWRRNNAR